MFNVGRVTVVGTDGDIIGLDGIVVVNNDVDAIGFCLFRDK